MPFATTVRVSRPPRPEAAAIRRIPPARTNNLASCTRLKATGRMPRRNIRSSSTCGRATWLQLNVAEVRREFARLGDTETKCQRRLKTEHDQRVKMEHGVGG